MKTLDTPSDRTTVIAMKRRGVTGKLVGVPDIARMLNRTRQTALTYSQHWSFPVPVDVLSPDSPRPQAIWWRKDVEKWVAENPEAIDRSKA